MYHRRRSDHETHCIDLSAYTDLLCPIILRRQFKQKADFRTCSVSAMKARFFGLEWKSVSGYDKLYA